MSIEEILKKLSIKMLIYGILILATAVITSTIYNFLYTPITYLQIPTPYGYNVTLNITGEDIVKILSSINNFEVKIVKKLSEEKRINEIIQKYKKEYIFYYDEFQKIYPERFFILCTQDGCSYYYFTVSGLIRANKTKLNKPLIIYLDKNYLNKLLDTLDKGNGRKALSLFKEGLISGKIRIKNFEIIAKRLAKRYMKK